MFRSGFIMLFIIGLYGWILSIILLILSMIIGRWIKWIDETSAIFFVTMWVFWILFVIGMFMSKM